MKKVIFIVGSLVVVGLVMIFLKKDIENITLIGKREVISTSIVKGHIFISTDGNGTRCIESEPCNFSRLDLFSNDKLVPKAGDTIFFREGIYKFSSKGVRRIYLRGGIKGKPITYESYPNEKVIFDGSLLSKDDTKGEIWREGRLQLRESYTILRKIEVQNMPQHGIRIFGNSNIVEGCIVHNNALSGIEIFNFKDGYSTKATGGSFNIVRDNIVFNNSDVNLKHHNYNDGGNADGITIHSGVGNMITHNTVYSNSDDGIDTWKSMNSRVEYNFVYDNGKGKFGDGYGIKLGGAPKDSPLGSNSIARYNISFKNSRAGFNVNGGKNVLIQYNTSYANLEYGYTLTDDSKVLNNVAYNNGKGAFSWSDAFEQLNNSWQSNELLNFISLDKQSVDFLRLVDNQTIGAYKVKDREK